ncbi:MAG TPA: hypothetical protein VNL77_02890 [Roseiflexaceae bacterium]|nr:hypothetical protein [Roseiflexaceae bacterium]
MITLELTSEEAGMLFFTLESYLTDLRGELRETDSRDYRAGLKQREAFLKKLLQQLQAQGAEPLPVMAAR